MTEFTQFKVEAPAGVNFSREPSQLNPMLWDSAENVTFRHGKTYKCSGYEQGFGKAYALPEVIVPLRDDDQNFYWWTYAGQYKLVDGSTGDISYQDRIYRILSRGTHEDVTPTGGISVVSPFLTELSWTGDTLNSVPYVTKDKPYYWKKDDNKFAPLDFPKHLHVKTIRTYRNFMIAMNFSTDDFEGDIDNGFGPWEAGSYQNALWWSHDIVGTALEPVSGDLSFWCDASPIRNSGWNFLGGAGGPIVDGKALRDMFVVYRERSVWGMTYIGGINVFAFKELFDDAGALGLDCVAEIEGQHFVVGQSDIYMHNGVQKKSVADGIVRKEIFTSIDPEHTNKVFVSVSYKDKEAWVCIPEAYTNVGGSCNIAYVFNWEEGTWSRRDIPNILSSSYTILSIPEGDITWDAQSEGGPITPPATEGVAIPGSTWEEATDIWLDSYFKYNPSQWGLALGAGIKNNDAFNGIYTSIEEPLYNGENGEAIIEKRWMSMNDRSDASFVNKVYPLVRNGVVDIYMCGTKTVDEGLTWKFLGTFDPSRDTKLSCRISGEFVHIKFVIPKTSRAEIRGYWLEFGKIGRRS